MSDNTASLFPDSLTRTLSEDRNEARAELLSMLGKRSGVIPAEKLQDTQ